MIRSTLYSQCLACFIYLCIGSATFAATPLTDKEAPTTQQRFSWQSSYEAAEQAMQAGLYRLAARLYTQARDLSEPQSEAAQQASLRLAFALINQGKVDEASLVIDTLSRREDSAYYLCLTLLSQMDNRFEDAQKSLDQINPETLSRSELPWFYLVSARAYEARGEFEQSLSALKQARELARNTTEESNFELLIYRHHILHGQVDENILEVLKRNSETFRGQDAGFTFAREYAIALHKKGQTKQALDMLEQQRTLARGRNTEDESILLLLIAAIGDPKSSQVRTALEELIRNGRGRLWQRMGLTLLMGNSELSSSSDALVQFLSSLIQTAPDKPTTPHPIIDELLLARARLLFNQNKLDEAAQDAQILIEQYPGSSIRQDALKIQAAIALSRSPPQYRTAANFFNQVRSELTDNEARVRLTMLIGDCYFLNEDFANAAEFYGQVLQIPANEDISKIALFQQVLSNIRNSDLESAEKNLDLWMMSRTNDSLLVWQAHWNYMDALNRAGKREQALKRAVNLLDKHLSRIPSELELRLMWLKARLSIDTPEVRSVPKIADDILALINRLKDKDLQSSERAIIASNTLLLKGQALIKMQQTDQAWETFQTLRTSLADTPPAIRSYIDEARYHLEQGNLIEAQQRFIQLSDRYPQSEYAPIALYEAALVAEQQGLQRTYEESVAILERLLNNYPKSEIAFYARLKQGDILRKLNNFGSARSRYEELLRNYPDHPRRDDVEMALAYTLLGQARNDPSRVSSSIVTFERLFDLPNLAPEMRIEAGFQWASALKTLNETMRAEEIYWQTLTRFLLEPPEPYTLGTTGRYWLARTAFELADIYEKQNRIQEAMRVFSLILEYQLPGINTAQSRMQRVSPAN